MIQTEIYEPDWFNILLSFESEICLLSTATPPQKSFCKIYWQKKVDVCQKTNPSLGKLYSFYEQIPEEVWTKTTKIVIFTTTFLKFFSPSIE